MFTPVSNEVTDHRSWTLCLSIWLETRWGDRNCAVEVREYFLSWNCFQCPGAAVWRKYQLFRLVLTLFWGKPWLSKLYQLSDSCKHNKGINNKSTYWVRRDLLVLLPHFSKSRRLTNVKRNLPPPPPPDVYTLLTSPARALASNRQLFTLKQRKRCLLFKALIFKK